MHSIFQFLDPITWTQAVALTLVCSPTKGGSISSRTSAAGFRPLDETPNDYFTLASSRHRGAEAPETEGLLCLPVGIATGTSFEMILATLLALIARTT